MPMRANRLGITNVIRSEFSAGVMEILDSDRNQEEKRTAALSLLDRVVLELQGSYGSVFKQHSEIKDRLLKPL